MIDYVYYAIKKKVRKATYHNNDNYKIISVQDYHFHPFLLGAGKTKCLHFEESSFDSNTPEKVNKWVTFMSMISQEEQMGGKKLNFAVWY